MAPFGAPHGIPYGFPPRLPGLGGMTGNMAQLPALPLLNSRLRVLIREWTTGSERVTECCTRLAHHITRRGIQIHRFGVDHGTVIAAGSMATIMPDTTLQLCEQTHRDQLMACRRCSEAE